MVGVGTALSGVLGAYAVLHPRAGVVSLTLVPFFATLVEAPALLLIAAWFLIALIPSAGTLVDPDLLLGTGLVLLGYATAFAAGRGRWPARPPAAPAGSRRGILRAWTSAGGPP